jgi:hypothetical protein
MHLDLTTEEAALFFGCCAALSTMTALGYRRFSNGSRRPRDIPPS